MLGTSLRRHGHQAALISMLAVLTLFGTLLAPPASAAVGAPSGIKQRTAATVTADSLPTVQINGVVYSQVVAGNTVYAAGRFTSARPAGAKAGTSEVARANLLAYDIRTGKLITSFAPQVNAQIKALALSSDKKTLYAVGNFNRVGSSPRSRFAAFDVATGALKTMAPNFNYTITSLAVSPTTVYVGGGFTSVNGVQRNRLAAVSATTGALTSWAPSADAEPKAMVMTPNQSMVVVGGAFAKLNTTAALGMGALDARTGATKTWKINTVVKDYGANSAILSLAADGDTIYGSGYAYGGGNFEGAFAASPVDGSVKWLQDCHGDTYSVAPVGDVLYSVGHAHYCQNIGGFPDSTPRTGYYRALAVTKPVAGTVATNGQPGDRYGDFGGQPAPGLINWFPTLQPGTFTGQTQSAWSVAGTSSYLLLGGEFTMVNGVAQQGLVRMAIPSLAPRKQGPTLTTPGTTPSASAVTANSATLSWRGNSDRDDARLTYDLLRNGVVVNTRAAFSAFWFQPLLSFVDSGLTPSTTYTYRVRVRDQDGNTLESAVLAVTTAVAPSTSPSSASPANQPEARQVEKAPVESPPLPAPTERAEASPAETPSAEPQPAEPTPAETTPVETTPAEADPAEARPTATVPAAEDRVSTDSAEVGPTTDGAGG